MMKQGLLATKPAEKRASEWRSGRWAWARHWEFWLALALGAALRLWRLDLTQYVEDPVRLFGLARAGVTQSLIPLTSNASSIHTMNPPLSIYLMMPFAATADPMPVVISIALWNVLGVALCYIFTLRYFGRRIASLSTLLFATSAYAITYSRFIWQPNYLPPVLILWALTLYLGCVDGRRRWFAGNITLLALAALLHSAAALLAPVTLVGAFLAPRIPRLRAWVTSALILLALVAPTLLWEAVSGFYDVRAARAYALGPSHITPAVFYYLYLAIGGPPIKIFGSSAPSYALNIFATLLFAIGWVVLTVRIIRPARALRWRRDIGMVDAARDWLAALYHGLRANAAWRVNLLLWLSVSVPVALMIRHTGGLTPHYLMSLYPTAFIVSSIGILSAIAWITRQVRARSARLASSAALALEIGVLLLVLARSTQWLSSVAALTDTATFNAYADYGYPLSVIQGGASELDQLQRRTGAAAVEVITLTDPRYRQPADAIFAGGRADRVTVTSSCLLLPSTATMGSWLITSVAPNAPAVSLLDSIAPAPPIGTLRMAGGPDYPVYQVSGAALAPAGAHATPPIFFDDGAGNSLQLTTLAPLGTGAIVAGWSVVSTRAPDGQSRYFTVTASAGGRSVATTCEAQRWLAGEKLYTILPLSLSSELRLSLRTGSDGLDIHTVGPLRFLSDLNGGQASVAMKPEPPINGAPPPHVTINSDGSITMPPFATP